MEKDETTQPEGDNLDLEPTEPEKEPDGSHSDPLDEISDNEELRKEAKKFRAIAQRKDKKPDPKPVEKKEIPKEVPSDYLKKSDFELANQKKAIRLTTSISDGDSEEIKIAKKDLLENWEQVKMLYFPRRGKDTPEDIMEDIQDAYVLFNLRRPKNEGDDGVADLSKTRIIPGQTVPTPQKVEKTPPNFNVSASPKDWYKKKE